jgi:methionyl-tRNA formyltransferase
MEEYANVEGWPVHIWKGNSHLIAELKSWNSSNIYDIGIVASFGHMLSRALCASFPRGIINIHPSLLPRWRGAAPIQHVLLSRDQKTGISVVQLETEAWDEGRILIQKSMAVPRNATFNQLSTELAEMGGNLLVDVLSNLDHLQAQAYFQDSNSATHAPKIPQHWQQIRFNNASDIACKFRAFGHQFGGLCCTTTNADQVRFATLQALPENSIPPILHQHLENGRTSVTAGMGFFHNRWNGVLVKCSEGWLVVTELKMKYKNVTKARDFANAYMEKSGVQGLKTIRFLEIT